MRCAYSNWLQFVACEYLSRLLNPLFHFSPSHLTTYLRSSLLKRLLFPISISMPSGFERLACNCGGIMWRPVKLSRVFSFSCSFVLHSCFIPASFLPHSCFIPASFQLFGKSFIPFQFRCCCLSSPIDVAVLVVVTVFFSLPLWLMFHICNTHRFSFMFELYQRSGWMGQ